MTHGGDTGPLCMYCGEHAPRLGFCAVCDRSVCEKCGNVQHVRDERRVLHNNCLRKDPGGFTMIRIVDD